MENNPTKFGLIILLLTLAVSAFGQQNLWSTVKSDSSDVKYVPLNSVTKEVLVFYDQYKFYFDLTGFSKKRFIDEIDYGFEDWSWLNSINELTVSALKSNSGRGSFVMILCISKDNVNLLIFSNDLMLHENAQPTGSYNKEKFANWFKTILN